MNLLNKPPYKYDSKRKVITNADNVRVLSMTGYSHLKYYDDLPQVLARRTEDEFGYIVEAMLNQETDTTEFEI